MLEAKTQTINMPNGQVITIETGKLARQADGAVLVRSGNLAILATVVSAKEGMTDSDFMPLMIDYREKFSAAGRFPGGFMKREARPSTSEILTMRLIDRALRPLFPDDYHADTHVLLSLMSNDDTIYPDTLACLAASASLAVSDVPFNGPISEVRIGRVNGEFIVNPTKEQLEESDIDMIIAATLDSVVMVEGEMDEISEAEMLEAIKIAHDAIKVQCTALNELTKLAGKEEKREYDHEKSDEELYNKIKDFAYDKFKDIAAQGLASKAKRGELFSEVKEAFLAEMSEEEQEEHAFLLRMYFSKVQKAAVRDVILNQTIRLDGRKMDEVRPIYSEVDLLPSTHGSALFTRGETQSLTSLTLGTKLDEQKIDTVAIEGTEKFYLHYNFPPFSTGEARMKFSVSRREIGHGNLAQRALSKVIPTGPENPYTIRLISDILESNGSSSMASVCAGTLALMDAGVQIKAPVSGIAMGLITDGDKYAVLSDILGDEDHLGDMDFKVTGTSKGITACQMDIKIDGLNYEILENALNQAKAGRHHILDEMGKTMTAPREDYKEHAPRIIQHIIPKDFIGAVIGPGGKVIQDLQERTGTTIVIEEIDGKGVIDIVSTEGSGALQALEEIKGICAVPEVGEIYDAKVKSIMPYGAFVEILPGQEGLLHISEIEHRRLEKVEDALKEGQQIQVKLLSIDQKTGKFKLSRKVLLDKPEGKPEGKPESKPQEEKQPEQPAE